MEKAGKALANADYTTAIRCYTEVIAADPDLSDALYSRATAYNNSGHFSKAITDYGRYLKLNPESGVGYYSRAHVFDEMGDYAKAISDYNRAISLGPWTQVGSVGAYNDLAWLLATCPEKKYRDGKKAIENANAAWEISIKRSANIMDTLAAAYAEAGDFAKAIEWEQKFLATPNLKEGEMKEATKRLVLYESGKPYHEEK